MPYFHCTNEPFADKIQFSLDKAREFNPDYILRCASDDWLSSNWCKLMLSKFESDTGFGATFVCHTVRCSASFGQAASSIQIVRHVVYKNTSRYGESLAPGRLWSCAVLDKIDWQLTKGGKHNTLDGVASRFAKKSGAKFFLYKGNAIVHINVPNDNSFHALLGRAIGIQQSELAKDFEQKWCFGMRSLCDLLIQDGFSVRKKWTNFIKPFSHAQMQTLMQQRVIDNAVLCGLEKMTQYLPDMGCEIFLEAKMEE